MTNCDLQPVAAPEQHQIGNLDIGQDDIPEDDQGVCDGDETARRCAGAATSRRSSPAAPQSQAPLRAARSRCRSRLRAGPRPARAAPTDADAGQGAPSLYRPVLPQSAAARRGRARRGHRLACRVSARRLCSVPASPARRSAASAAVAAISSPAMASGSTTRATRRRFASARSGSIFQNTALPARAKPSIMISVMPSTTTRPTARHPPHGLRRGSSACR